MDHCPFCGTEIRHEIARLGGSCPRCLSRVPGEDAPTELGADVDPVRSGGTGPRGWGYASIAAGLLLGSVGALLWAIQPWAWGPSVDDMAMDAPLVNTPVLVGVATSTTEPRVAVPEVAQTAPSQVPAARGAALQRSVDGPPADEGDALQGGTEIRRMIGDKMREAVPQLSHCYTRRLKQDPQAGGRFRLVLAVTEDGGVDDVRVEPLGEEDRTLQACLVHHVRMRWLFEPISQRSVVSRTLSFQPPR